MTAYLLKGLATVWRDEVRVSLCVSVCVPNVFQTDSVV